MKKEIEHFEFMCSLNYLHEHQREFSCGSIFIYSIIGFDCEHLIVKFFRISDKTSYKLDMADVPADSGFQTF